MQRTRQREKLPAATRTRAATNNNTNASKSAPDSRHQKLRRRRDDTSSTDSLIPNGTTPEDERRWNEMKRLIRLDELKLSTILGDLRDLILD